MTLPDAFVRRGEGQDEIGTDEGDLHRGSVWRNGEQTSLSEWPFKTKIHVDGVTQKIHFVTAVDKKGRKHELRGDIMRVFPGGTGKEVKSKIVVNEGLTLRDLRRHQRIRNRRVPSRF